ARHVRCLCRGPVARRAISTVLAAWLLCGCASTGTREKVGASLAGAGFLVASYGTGAAVGACSPDTSYCAGSAPAQPSVYVPMIAAGALAFVVGVVVMTARPSPHPRPPVAPADPADRFLVSR
ncbi:MAG: hypothetical protein ACRELB_01235, partial [Polyangiaceae bacterium]